VGRGFGGRDRRGPRDGGDLDAETVATVTGRIAEAAYALAARATTEFRTVGTYHSMIINP
jgi:hypothetical protein